MSELYASPSFGIALTVLVYWVGVKIQKKTGLVICNNMIIAVGLLIAILAVFHIPYDDYNQGGSIINMFLGPATACLAVSIYSKIDLLKKNWLPVLVGCLVGVVTSVGSILIMCRLFGLDRDMTVSLLPKSVTTPIAVAVSSPGFWAISWPPSWSNSSASGIRGQWGWASVRAAMLWVRPRRWKWARPRGP